MTTLTLAIVIVFGIGYFFIAIESVTKINKAAIALLMLVVTWTLFMLEPASYLPRAVGDQMASVVNEAIERHLPPFLGILMAVAGLLHRCRRLNAHYRQCCRCGSDGIGEDYLRMVHEAHFMGRLPRLSCWHSVLLD